MRGSSLSHASVVEILRPFIVSSWTGRRISDAPAEVRAVYDQLDRRMPSNIVLFVLDRNAKVIDAFVPFPRGDVGSLGFDPDRMGRYVRDKVATATRGMRLPKVAKSKKIHAPDIDDLGLKRGVRIFLSLSSRLQGNYKMPTVEVVPWSDAQRTALAFPRAARTVPASALKGWLEQLYPPAIMSSTGYVRKVSGALRLAPEGRLGVLTGKVSFDFDDGNDTRYQGSLALRIEYGADGSPSSVRGVFDGSYPKRDRRHRRVTTLSMKAAIESRPK